MCQFDSIYFFQSKKMAELVERAGRKMEREAVGWPEFKVLVAQWVEGRLQPVDLVLKPSFRKLKEIDRVFLGKCVTYLIPRHFPWLVRDLKEEYMISLNEDLKAQYKQMVMESYFKGNSSFQIFIICVVKQAVQFLLQHFNNILTDISLQAELSVILFFTFLGLEVNKRAYEVMHRKYVGDGKGKDKEEFKSSKNSFSDGVGIKSSKKLASFNYKFNKGSQHFSRESKDTLLQFTNLLKESLHVEPLPPLKRKKRDFRELQRINTEPCEILDRSLSNKQSEDPLSMKKCIYSNQLSSTFKVLHPGMELKSAKVKCNQSFYHFRKESKARTGKEKENEGIVDLSVGESPCVVNGPKDCKHWQQVVAQLKRKTLALKKKRTREVIDGQEQMQPISQQSSLRSTSYHNSSPPNSRPNQPPNPILKQIDDKQTSNPQSCFQRESHPALDSSFSIKNFEEGELRVMSNLFCKGGKRSGLNKNSIRLQKDSFFSTCSARRSQLLQVKKINLHADWIINHYKQ